MEELRSMLGWILVHWRAQKDQLLSRQKAEEPQTDAIYSEATVCTSQPQVEPILNYHKMVLERDMYYYYFIFLCFVCEM